MSAPALLIAAPASHQGKTTVAIGLQRAFRRRGLRVGAFKVGPDYIDPAFHARATGRVSHNLDAWAMRFGTLVGLAEAAGRDADIVVGEGVMGLFDGAIDGTGSTADVAALLGLPVILVIDVGGMGASAAALVDGFRRHRDDVAIDGLILNRVASEAHADLVRRAVDEHVSTPVIGALRRDQALTLPSRHLGLVQAIEHPDLEPVLERAADVVSEALDLDRLLRLARAPAVSVLGGELLPVPPLGQRIAVARDAAFAFTYPAVLEGWRRRGAELSTFSPLADEAPRRDSDAVYLPGGYPELHAGRLAAASGFLAGLRAVAERRAFIFGECGGYMVLGRHLTDADGATHRMAGLLPAATSFAVPRLTLGYRRIECLTHTPLGRTGAGFCGHEFHYASETECGGEPLFAARAADGRRVPHHGCRAGTVAGSFLHLIDRAAPDGRAHAPALGKPPAAA